MHPMLPKNILKISIHFNILATKISIQANVVRDNNDDIGDEPCLDENSS